VQDDSRSAGEIPITMHTVRINDEFGTLRTAVVHDASNAVDHTMEDLRSFTPAEELKDHPESGSSHRERIIELNARFRQVLAENGVTLLSPATQADAFCQVFTRDPCFAIGDTLLVGNLRDEYRQAEIAGLRELRRQFPKVINLSGDGATIEGGDVVVLDEGRRVLVGTNRHTNEAGFRKLTAALAGSGTEVLKVPHRALHLDCCLAPLPDRSALCAPVKLPAESMDVLETCFGEMIPLDPDEAARHLAANIFWIDRRRVVSSSATKKTNEVLRRRGYHVIELDFSDLVFIWGSFRCAVCPIERA
jgi:N-dimethylarginine dimethylaminohydrolase